MLGSVLHRIGVGLDVGVIKVNGAPRVYRRSASVAERDYKESVKQRKKLDEKIKKKTATPEQIELRDKMVAEEPAKLKLASDSITNSYPADLKTFSAKLRGNTEVRQTFDPWEMEDNTRDDKAATQNDLTDGNETLHATHLHITVFDAELGHG